MRQPTRVLGWTVNLSLLILFSFVAVSGYSMMKTIAVDRGIGFGEFDYEILENSFSIIIPISINNTGYFDFTDFQVNTSISDAEGNLIADGSINIPSAERGSIIVGYQNITLDLNDISAKNLTYLLLNESELILSGSVKFQYAHAYSFQIDVPETPMHWSPPLYGLEVAPLFYNYTDLKLHVQIHFENRSPMHIDGTMSFDIYNDEAAFVGSGSSEISVPPYSIYEGVVKVEVDDLTLLTEKGQIHIYFEKGEVSFGPVVTTYG